MKNCYETIALKAFWGVENENILSLEYPGGCTMKEAIDYFNEHGEELEALGLIKTEDNRFDFDTINVYTKGDLKGYADGYITFRYQRNGTESECNHEFLYRFDDAENGQNDTLVSIDYGYEIPYIDRVWQDITIYLKEYVKKKLCVTA